MLTDKLRAGAQGRIFKILFWIIILSFIFTGVGGYLIPKLNTDPVTVGDYKISAQEWNEMYNRQAQQLHRTYGASMAKLLEQPEYVKDLRLKVLEGLVDNVALNSAVYDLKIRIGDEQVREAIRAIPAFQKDGRFDNDLYLAVIRNSGQSPETFGEQLRLSLMTDTLTVPVTQLASAPMPYETEQMTKLLTQQREVALYKLKAAALQDQVKLDESAAKQYFDAHHDEFMEPASVKFNYVVLNSEDLKAEIKPDDRALEDYFNLHQDEFVRPEKRDVSMIFLSQEHADKSDLISKELKSGADFAALAKQYSDDPASKDKGGYLGAFERGKLPAAVDQALFALKQAGEVSAAIKDEGGVMFVRLDRIEAAHTPDFTALKSEVRTHYIEAKVKDLYAERSGTLADLSFENPDSLDTAAQNLKLKIQDSGLLKQGAADTQWPLNLEAVQAAAFDRDNQTSGTNSNVINLSDTASMVINIYDHKDAALKDFAAVKEEALRKASSAEALKQAEAQLKLFASELTKDPQRAAPAAVQNEGVIKLDRAYTKLDPNLVAAVFAIPTQGNERYTVIKGQDEITLAVLKSVSELEDQKTKEAYNSLVKAQLGAYLSARSQQALYRQARALSDISYNEDAIATINAQNNPED